MKGQAHDKFPIVTEDQKSVCSEPSSLHPTALKRLNSLLFLLQGFWISAFSIFLSSNDLFPILLLFYVYPKFVQFSSTAVFMFISEKK